ncbi:MAG TPA: DUF1345 domain-containing protein [Vitreimonas sp.]|nr:DUF1345 domain-containing protein [Vitreimonas sp.]
MALVTPADAVHVALMAKPLSSGLRAVMANQPLRAALIGGVLGAVVINLTPSPLSPLSRALAAWDVALAVYLVTLLLKMRRAHPESIAKRAAENDEGRHFTLLLSLTAVTLSVVAAIAEVGAGASESKSWHVAFVFGTVALSWLFVHTTLAAHYTHEYYGPDDDGEGTRGGLIFPGNEKPDFWDFWHFALVIGVANQTADIQISSKTIRRIVTLHGVIAFVFNTVILALTINQAASLFS